MSSDQCPQDPIPRSAVRREGEAARSADATALLALRLIAANARLNALALVTAVGLIVLGLWVYTGVKQSLQGIRAAGLHTVLDAEVQALELWVGDKKTNVEHWAKDAQVRRAARRSSLRAFPGGSMISSSAASPRSGRSARMTCWW